VSTRPSDNSLFSKADCVFVSNSDVYVVGSEVYDVARAGRAASSSIAMLWENGTRQRLGDVEINYWTSAKSVFVANGNVFVAGDETRLDGKYAAVLWKNGAVQYLGVGQANAVFVK